MSVVVFVTANIAQSKLDFWFDGYCQILLTLSHPIHHMPLSKTIVLWGLFSKLVELVVMAA